MAQVSAIQRQRIAYLMQLEASRNGLLDKAERDELTALQKLAGIAPDAPISLVNKWAAGLLGATMPNSLQRSMSPRQRVVETLQHRWPEPRLTPRQKTVELLRLKAEFDMTPKQRVVNRLRVP
jgi:hypothetical protein